MEACRASPVLRRIAKVSLACRRKRPLTLLCCACAGGRLTATHGGRPCSVLRYPCLAEGAYVLQHARAFNAGACRISHLTSGVPSSDNPHEHHSRHPRPRTPSRAVLSHHSNPRPRRQLQPHLARIPLFCCGLDRSPQVIATPMMAPPWGSPRALFAHGLAMLASWPLAANAAASVAGDYFVRSLPGAPKGDTVKMHAG